MSETELTRRSLVDQKIYWEHKTHELINLNHELKSIIESQRVKIEELEEMVREARLERDDERAKIEIAEKALQFLYDEIVDYIKINNLGAMNNQSMRMAREGLQIMREPK